MTIDFETLDDQAVTVRDRDSMGQERVPSTSSRPYFAERLVGC